MDPRIADYIRANRKRYTREAITRQLVDAGHDPSEIEQAWADLDARAGDPDAVAGEGFWGRFLLTVVGINVAVVVVIGLVSGAFTSPDRLGLLGILSVVLAIGALLAWAIVAATGPTKLGRRSATVIGVVVPLAFALLIGGACYALVAGMGPPPRTGTIELEVEGVPDLSGSGSATCQAGGTQFSVFGQLDLPRYTTVDVNSYPPDGGPPTGQVEGIFIFTEGPQPEQQIAFSNASSGASLSSSVERGGLQGSVAFTNLGSDIMEPGGPDVDAISGTITWTCE